MTTGLSHTLAESSIKISRMALGSILDRAASFLSISSSTGVIDVHPVLRNCIEARYLCYTDQRKSIHSLLYHNCMRACDPMVSALMATPRSRKHRMSICLLIPTKFSLATMLFSRGDFIYPTCCAFDCIDRAMGGGSPRTQSPSAVCTTTVFSGIKLTVCSGPTAASRSCRVAGNTT